MSQMLDPTFYRSPAEAIAAPPERLAYVAAYDPAGQAKDAMAVLDIDPILRISVGLLRPILSFGRSRMSPTTRR